MALGILYKIPIYPIFYLLKGDYKMIPKCDPHPTPAFFYLFFHVILTPLLAYYLYNTLISL